MDKGSTSGITHSWQKDTTFPYDTSIHQYFGELETQTHP